jgi:fructosamine-3-kinase
MAYSLEQDIIRMCIEKLTEIYGTSVQLNGSRLVGGGCINHALKISTTLGDFFLKWNASAAADMFQKEAAGLTEMALSNSSLVIPRVIWSKEMTICQACY